MRGLSPSLAGRLQTSPNHALVTKTRRLLMRQALHMRAPHWQSLLQAIIHWQAVSDSWSLPLQTSRAAVSRMRKHGIGHTYSMTNSIQRWSPHTIPAWTSLCNFSALCYPLRLFSFTTDSELTWHSQYTDCILLHATPKTNSDSVNNIRQPWVKWTFLRLQLQLILGWFNVSRTTGISSIDHCLSICLTSFRIQFTVSSGVLSSNSAIESAIYSLFLWHHSIPSVHSTTRLTTDCENAMLFLFTAMLGHANEPSRPFTGICYFRKLPNSLHAPQKWPRPPPPPSGQTKAEALF